MMNQVAIGFLGTTLDAGQGEGRWHKWRPTVDLCRSQNLARLELLHDARFTAHAQQIAADIGEVAPDTRVVLHVVNIADPWDFEQVYAALLDFCAAYPFDLEREEYLAHITTGTHVAQICMYLLAESRRLPGRLAQTSVPSQEARERLNQLRSRKQPCRLEAGVVTIIDLELARYDELANRFAGEADRATEFLKSGIETKNPRFNALIARIEQVALGSSAPLLLTGPTGAGKSQLARRIFELKQLRHRVKGQFVEVNCATLRGDGAMSALFGHKKGAFTGALQDRPGLLRSADGGVLFLDEIGELGADEQAMLLRAIEDKRFLPVGADREVKSDFQLIAGTNRDLRAEVAAGRFREDLLARIDLWTFALPALRERPEDIEPNLDFELERFCGKSGRRVRFNREARERFVRFAQKAPWPANFRELGAAVERMATLAPAGRITETEVREEVERLEHSWRRDEFDLLRRLLSHECYAELDRFDLVQLADVATVCRQSPTLAEAGRRLFAVSRTRREKTNDADRLRKYLLRFDLEFRQLKE